MKLKKFITLGLAAVMATSAIGTNAIAADSDNEIVYSYADENNNIINITQSDLDAEHWNKEALGDTAPAIYENFPMKMTGYTNDFSELSLDIVYMKKLEDMDKVSLTITDLNDGNIVYNSLLTEESFYSPVLDEKGQYDVELTEVIDGQTTNYKRIVCVKKEDAEMPSYVTNPSENNNDIVLIANTNDLRCGETTDDDGKIIVNPQIAKYTPIHTNEFKDYCNSLPDGNIYRVFTISDNRQYAGFFSKDYGDNIYNLTIETYTESDFYAPSEMSLPSVSISDIQNKASELRISDSSFRLKESSTSGKYAVYEVYLPDSYVGSTDKNGQFRITVTGTSKIAMKLWSHTKKNTTPTALRTYTSSNNENSTYVDIRTSDYQKTADFISFYVMVYFTSAVDGYGMINVEPINGYEDDVNGSINDAYNGIQGDQYTQGNNYRELNNTEFYLTDAWDVDAFCMDYWGTDSKIYKIEIRNRSLSDQAKLERGEKANGGKAKYLTLWSADVKDTVVNWNSTTVYTIPKNTDMVIYCDPTYQGEKIISVNSVSTGSTSADYYQLSYKIMQ